MGKRWYYMGIIKYFRKKYWEAAIFRGGRRIPFSCDGLTAVPDRAYTFEKNQSFISFHEELSVSMISRFQLEQDNSLIPTVFPKLKLVMKYLPVLTSVSGYVVTAWSLSIWMDRSSGFINKKHLKKEKSVSSSLMVMLM